MRYRYELLSDHSLEVFQDRINRYAEDGWQLSKFTVDDGWLYALMETVVEN